MKNLKRILFYTILLILLVVAVWAFVIEPGSLNVTHYDLKVKNWSPKLNGFKIVAVSDIHGGANFIDEEKLRKIVELANEQDADLIVLLGDYVSQQNLDFRKLHMPMATIADNLKGLRAKHGVYAIIGNHDGWYDRKIVRYELERVGLPVLENEAVSIEKNGERLRIVGLPDFMSGSVPENNIPTAREGLKLLGNEEGKIIVLTHNPDDIAYVTEKASLSSELVLFLAGHTHGGQCRFPIIGAPVVPSAHKQKYAAGHVRDKNVDMFITTGIGTSLIPVRFMVPPEISVLNISAE
jgi:predicted MPP superfamily phosphohydrolase